MLQAIPIRKSSRLRDLLLELKKRATGHRVSWERLKEAFLAKHTRESVETLHRQYGQRRYLALSAKTHTAVKVIQDEQRFSRQEQHDAITASKRWREEDKAQDTLR